MRHQCLRTDGGREQERKEVGKTEGEEGKIEIERRRDGRKGEKRNRQKRKKWELVEERGERYGDTE